MRRAAKHPRTAPDLTKEKTRMPKRLTALATLLAAVLLLALPAASASAASPWWQVVTGSHPTNLWEPKPAELEIETELGEFFEFEGAAIEIKVAGTTVGCLGTKNLVGEAFCLSETTFMPTETAAELESLLEASFGGAAVDVTGGPVGGEPFTVVASGATPAVELEPDHRHRETQGHLGRRQRPPGRDPDQPRQRRGGRFLRSGDHHRRTPGGSGRLGSRRLRRGQRPLGPGQLLRGKPEPRQLQLRRHPASLRSDRSRNPRQPHRRPPGRRGARESHRLRRQRQSAHRYPDDQGQPRADPLRDRPLQHPGRRRGRRSGDPGRRPSLPADQHDPVQLQRAQRRLFAQSELDQTAGPAAQPALPAARRPGRQRNRRSALPHGGILRTQFQGQLPAPGRDRRRLGDDRRTEFPRPDADRGPRLQPAPGPGRARSLRLRRRGRPRGDRHRPRSRGRLPGRRRSSQRDPARRHARQHRDALGEPRRPAP